jgi:hypothetical protein
MTGQCAINPNSFQDTEPVCLRCGQCCHYEFGGKVRKCHHLVKLPNGKTLCRIYNRRLGVVIQKNDDGINHVRCSDRRMVKKNYPGCPFNKSMFGDML